MDSNETTVEAKGGVTLVYKEYILTADRATYHRKSGELELYNNIRFNQGNSYKILGEYARLNIAKKERVFQPFYLSDKKTEVWMSAKEGYTQDKNIEVSSGVLSGCDPVNPLWKIEFSSSDYNSQTKWTNIYNARLYIEDIPVFYTPYFGYSLDTTRRTGLLMPSFGYSDSEGMYFEQPLYIAEQNWWDLELRAQVRTNRGAGIYQTFRFVDSPTSKGEFKAGYFKEKSSYFLENNLQNQSHYGFEIDYANKDFINQWFGFSLEGQSELYLDITHMNDVDYINLASNDTQNDFTATQVLSRVNMFYNTQEQFIGSYFKYYQDLTLPSNAETLQKLPTLQYHYYLDTLLKDHLLYSLDVQSNNITRSVGKTVVQTDINLPVTLQTSLFDEYLNISYVANLYMQHSMFGGETNATVLLNDGYIARNYHTLSASSQLTKAYDDFIHVVSFGATYDKTGVESKNGFYEDYQDFCSQEANKALEECQFYNISSVEDELQLDFIQYIYDENAKQVLYQRLAQRVAYTSGEDLFGELENELDYQITKYLNFYNNMFFNYDENAFSKVFNRITFDNHSLKVALSHLYKDSFIDDTLLTQRYTNYFTSSFTYTYDKHYSFSGLYNYDIELNETKSKEVGFLYKKRCWDFGIRYSENRRPVLTTDGESFIDDRFVYITVILKPIMKSNKKSLITYKVPK